MNDGLCDVASGHRWNVDDYVPGKGADGFHSQRSGAAMGIIVQVQRVFAGTTDHAALGHPVTEAHGGSITGDKKEGGNDQSNDPSAGN